MSLPVELRGKRHMLHKKGNSSVEAQSNSSPIIHPYFQILKLTPSPPPISPWNALARPVI